MYVHEILKRALSTNAVSVYVDDVIGGVLVVYYAWYSFVEEWGVNGIHELCVVFILGRRGCE